jgi:SHS2 domain-containing protein
MFDGKIKEKKNLKIKVKGKNSESLLYNFLEEFLFLLDTENFFLSKIKNIKIKDNELTAEASGDNVKNYEVHLDVKAVTYNEMFVKKNKEGWVGQVVVDV